MAKWRCYTHRALAQAGALGIKKCQNLYLSLQLLTLWKKNNGKNKLPMSHSSIPVFMMVA